MAATCGRPQPVMRRLKYRFEYALLRLLVFGLQRVPWGVAMWLARALGEFAFDILRLRRRVTLENLQAVWGGTRERWELSALGRAVYRQVTMTFVEVILLARGDRQAWEGRMSCVGWEHHQAAVAAGDGVIYLSAHVGNWEMLGAYLSGHGPGPVHVVVGDQRNPHADGFIKRTRHALGMEVIPRGAALKGILRALRRGDRVALLADQDAGRDGLYLNFLGRPAATAMGPARLAYSSGAPIVIVLDRRLKDGRHESYFHPPIRADRRRPQEEEVARIMTLYCTVLDDFVRRYPDQWFWVHRRWKSRP